MSLTAASRGIVVAAGLVTVLTVVPASAAPVFEPLYPRSGQILTRTYFTTDLKWRQSEGKWDRVLIYNDERPARGQPNESLADWEILGPEAAPCDACADADGQPARPGANGSGPDYHVRSQILLVGRYYWHVAGRDAAGNPVVSPLWTFDVRGRPLRRLAVKLRQQRRNSRRRPGRTTFRFRGSSGTLAKLFIRWRGKTIVKTPTQAEYADGRMESYTYRWRCGRTGRHGYTVVAWDRYGNRRRKSGSFRTYCPARRPSGGGGGGGGRGGGGSGTCSADGMVFDWIDASCRTAKRLWRTYGINGYEPSGWYCGGDRFRGGCDTAGVSGLSVGDRYVSWYRR